MVLNLRLAAELRLYNPLLKSPVKERQNQLVNQNWWVLYEGLNGVNRQPSNGPKINRQPSETEYFYRQPSNDRAKISRQIS